MPDDAAKGFGRSVSLDAAGAEGDEPCATAALKHTHPSTTQRTHSALPSYFVESLGLGSGMGLGLHGISLQYTSIVSAAASSSSHVFPSGTVRRKRASLTRRGGCQ